MLNKLASNVLFAFLFPHQPTPTHLTPWYSIPFKILLHTVWCFKNQILVIYNDYCTRSSKSTTSLPHKEGVEQS